MNINETSVMISEEDRNWLKLFFQNNTDFMKNNSLIEYENIQQFANLYEQFLAENNLKDNDILRLFLAELRYEQLCYKITTNSNKMKMQRMSLSIFSTPDSKCKLSDCISKWYHESHIEFYVSSATTEELNRSIQQKAKQNQLQREKSSWNTQRI